MKKRPVLIILVAILYFVANSSFAIEAPLTKKLIVGTRNAEVMTLQKILIKKGYLIDTADGSFGQKTLKALKAFQLAQGLQADGITGPKTRLSLNNEIANTGINSTSTTQTTYLVGCTSTTGYSLTTGVPCSVNKNTLINSSIIKNKKAVSKHECNQNQFTSAFLLISPDPRSQETKESLAFFEHFKTTLEKSFNEATYGRATMKVDTIFVTKLGSENYLRDPSQINFKNPIKDLIAKNGDKFDFVNVFTTYDAKSSAYSFSVQNFIKNTGQTNIFNESNEYGSNGKLLSITFQGDLYSRYKIITAPDANGNSIFSATSKSLFGIGNLLHEIGHHQCCYIGGSFTGNKNSPKLEILSSEGIHLYGGLESPARTQDVLGTVPWLLDTTNNTYYQDNTADYPLRYHPITLYFLGLLPKDQYSQKFNVFDAGTDNQFKSTGVKIYKTISVNDIIKFAGERTCVQ